MKRIKEFKLEDYYKKYHWSQATIKRHEEEIERLKNLKPNNMNEYFMGIDPGLGKDRTAIIVSKKLEDGTIKMLESHLLEPPDDPIEKEIWIKGWVERIKKAYSPFELKIMEKEDIKKFKNE